LFGIFGGAFLASPKNCEQKSERIALLINQSQITEDKVVVQL